MLIRLGEKKDFPSVVNFLLDFKTEEPAANGLIPPEDELMRLMPAFVGTSLIAQSDGVDVGVLAGLVMDHPFRRIRVWQEVFWYIKPEYRRFSKEMLKALENACLNWDVRMVIMAHFGCQKRERLDRFYEINSYQYMETHYFKELKDADKR